MADTEDPPERQGFDECDEIGNERLPAIAVSRLLAVAVSPGVDGEHAVTSRQRRGDRRPHPRMEAGRVMKHRRGSVAAVIEVVEADAIRGDGAASGSRASHERGLLFSRGSGARQSQVEMVVWGW